MQNKLSKAVFRGAYWAFIQSIGSRVFALLSQLALALILTPDVFGIVGIVIAASTISSSFFNIGLEDIFLQRSGKFGIWAPLTFWVSIFLGLGGMLVTCLCGLAAAQYYGNSQLSYLFLINALAMPFMSANALPVAVLRAGLRFRLISVLNMADNMLTQASTVLLAIYGFEAYSFFLPLPFIAIIKLMILWQSAKFEVRYFAKWRSFQIAYIASSGLKLLTSRLAVSVATQGDYIILGLLASKVEVGLYYFAFKLSAQPLYLFASNFSSVLYPSFVALRFETRRQIDAVLNSSKLLAYLITPICFAQAIFVGPLLLLVFGDKWSGAIPIIQILSIGLSFDAISWVTTSAFNANKMYSKVVRLTVGFLPLFLLLVPIGAYFGQAMGTAMAVSGYYAIYGPASALVLFKPHNISTRDILLIFGKPLIMAVISYGIHYSILAAESLPIQLVVLGFISPVLYLWIAISFEPRLTTYVFDKLLGKRAYIAGMVLKKIRLPILGSERKL